MEMSHRGKEFQSIIDAAEADLRALLGIPDNYKVLFMQASSLRWCQQHHCACHAATCRPLSAGIVAMQGGASTQFSAIPLNLCTEGDTVDYIVTGSWSKKAAGGGCCAAARCRTCACLPASRQQPCCCAEAKKYAKVNVAATGDNKSIPETSSWKLSPGGMRALRG